jgi:hypothetical protein
MILVRVILIFSLVVSMLSSFHLWGGERNFPYSPLIETGTVHEPFDTILMTVAILSWIASLLLRKQRLFLVFSFLLCCWMVVMDVNRLQPWFYCYNAMLAVYIFYNGRVDDPNKYTSYFIILQIIVASVYFFAGLSQLNDRFAEGEFTRVILPLNNYVSDRQFKLFVKFGQAVPYLLVFVGAGLMINSIRYLAIALAILFHVMLLVFLFPSAGQTNYALWISNLVFMALVTLLFSGKTKQRYFSPTFLFQLPLFYIVMAFFVVMPFFNRREQWPDFLSFNFRSNNNRHARFIITREGFDRLPLYEKHFYSFTGYDYELDYEGWAREELNADCYPSIAVFNSIHDYLQRIVPGDVKETELTERQ